MLDLQEVKSILAILQQMLNWIILFFMVVIIIKSECLSQMLIIHSLIWKQPVFSAGCNFSSTLNNQIITAMQKLCFSNVY